MNTISLTLSKSSYFGKCSFLNFRGKLSSRRVSAGAELSSLNLSDYLTSEISSLVQSFAWFCFFHCGTVRMRAKNGPYERCLVADGQCSSHH